MNLEAGDVITLEDNKDFIVVSIEKEKDNIYFVLMSNFKPLEIRIVEEIKENGETFVQNIVDQDLKEKLLSKLDKENLD